MAHAVTLGLEELQRAVYNALSTPPITTELGCGVYDDVPEGAPLPFIRIVTAAGDPWDTMARVGHTHLVDLHVFTNYQGSMQAYAILDAIVAKLDGVALFVPGYRVADIAREVHREGVDELVAGVKTQHRIAPYRVLLLDGEQP